jgi:hypothetical protein
MKIGDIVLVPCQVVGTGTFAYSGNLALDLVPIEKGSGEPYAPYLLRPFTVYADDVILKEEE